jgi:hypothetical protein
MLRADFLSSDNPYPSPRANSPISAFPFCIRECEEAMDFCFLLARLQSSVLAQQNRVKFAIDLMHLKFIANKK